MASEVRLIDANAMRQDWLENGQNEYVYDTNAVLGSIDEQPTIDPESLRPVGRKERSTISKTGLMCTNCYSDVDLDAVFCKYCGAKMEV